MTISAAVAHSTKLRCVRLFWIRKANIACQRTSFSRSAPSITTRIFRCKPAETSTLSPSIGRIRTGIGREEPRAGHVARRCPGSTYRERPPPLAARCRIVLARLSAGHADQHGDEAADAQIRVGIVDLEVERDRLLAELRPAADEFEVIVLGPSGRALASITLAIPVTS